MSSDSLTTLPTECPFTIVPIKGMEFVQQNFMKYKDGDQAALESVGSKKVTLAKRFQLLERGYVLQLKENVITSKSANDSKECILDCQSPVLVNVCRKKKNKKNAVKKSNVLLPACCDNMPLALPTKALNPVKLLSEKQNIKECIP